MSAERDAARMRAQKASGPMTEDNTGGANILSGKNLAAVLDETVARSNILRNGARIVQLPVGITSVDFSDFAGQYWTHIPTDGDVAVQTSRPEYREVEFDPQRYVMNMERTRKARLRPLALTGSDPTAAARAGFETQFGNSMARSLIIGDTTSADTSLSGNDGIYTRAAAGGMEIIDLAEVVGGVRVAVPYNPTQLYPRAELALDQAYQSQMSRWYIHPNEATHFGNWLQDQGKSDALTERFWDKGLVAGPLGKPFLKTDFWPEEIGPSADPTAVVDDGDGTMTVRVNSILPDAYGADSEGRLVRITLDATGESEDVLITRVAGQNVIATTGDLDQAVISVVAADYTVQIIDERSNILADPNNFALGLVDDLRSYLVFDTDKESEILKVNADMDTQIIRGDAAVMVIGYYLPTLGA